MISFQDAFANSTLNVVLADTSIAFPYDDDIQGDDWLTALKSTDVERSVAFFDEKLEYYLTAHLTDFNTGTGGPGFANERRVPPPHLLAFLAHVQVSYDAAYISSAPIVEEPQANVAISPPPTSRTTSLLGPSRRPRSIFPPTTPHPIPSAGEADRKYVKSEGTPLTTGIWGDNPDEAFQLLWSRKEKAWVAVFKLVVAVGAPLPETHLPLLQSLSTIVAFVRMHFEDPLLCLTASATLREKPIPLTGPRKRLADLITEAGGDPSDPMSPLTPIRGPDDNTAPAEQLARGLEEVNLLGGIASVPTFRDENINLPSTRLGAPTRREAFSLPPVSPGNATTASSPTSTIRSAVPILRKSHRKTLRTVSGFKVRMRTVLVPYVLFPEADADVPWESNVSAAENAEEWDRERREAGNDESTVVLCVEIENCGESDMTFMIEGVDVFISGQGAKTTLIKWGDSQNIFPLPVPSMAQYNLLYAVTFVQPPDADGVNSIGKKQAGELQRSVSITINGKPREDRGSLVIYPTKSFSSKWNCVLDLGVNINKDLPLDGSYSANRDALPTPASPFPGRDSASTLLAASIQPGDDQKLSAVSGSRRHTMDATGMAPRSIHKPPVNYRSSTAMLNPAFINERDPQQHLSPAGSGGFILPSVVMQQSQSGPRTPTAYTPRSGTPPPIAPPFGDDIGLTSPPPITPAYPSFPTSSGVHTPTSQSPIHGFQSSVGPSMEIRRGGSTRVFGGTAGENLDSAVSGESDGEPIVVSIGVLPFKKHESGQGSSKSLIFPNDKFTLDIFVFNKSSWMRRFEVAYPDSRASRKGGGQVGPKRLGIIPLENRIRVGPLRPSTCQSVRMDFLALMPGVHSVDTLTLTDVETGHSVNLRSVVDIVVHEPLEP
ncbi:TRAPP trafficking subunit Trs65-domain-containing protein [Thelephora terrestris]|uniref:TRAPP trafficking subunit Trs65-domain-containing protein n=1 Tax=Thelephora terrestris TaxID=56493 RepID=A0A9P6HR85_9AGAM|nr:TRAPP trafficking subunit Trs65-domain-containing protein [Thelephora terrestris]